MEAFRDERVRCSSELIANILSSGKEGVPCDAKSKNIRGICNQHDSGVKRDKMSSPSLLTPRRFSFGRAGNLNIESRPTRAAIKLVY